jgi:release factor glutamine methyltransferase
MTVREAWASGVQTLRQGEVTTASPELDARVLLCRVLETDLTGLLRRYSEPFPQQVSLLWVKLLAERARGTPVAWLVGHQEFMGIEFLVAPGVLVPRADTETLVEAALELLSPLSAEKLRVADVCTGSGCVGLSLAASARWRMSWELWLTDLSPEALAVARANTLSLASGLQVKVVDSDLLAEVPGELDLIVSNPPYLTTEETRHRKASGWQEPSLALDGGEDGLDLVRRLLEQSRKHLAFGGWVLLEAAEAQMDTIEAICRQAGFSETRFWHDLSGGRRVLGACRQPL